MVGFDMLQRRGSEARMCCGIRPTPTSLQPCNPTAPTSTTIHVVSWCRRTRSHQEEPEGLVRFVISLAKSNIDVIPSTGLSCFWQCTWSLHRHDKKSTTHIHKPEWPNWWLFRFCLQPRTVLWFVWKRREKGLATQASTGCPMAIEQDSTVPAESNQSSCSFPVGSPPHPFHAVFHPTPGKCQARLCFPGTRR